jgi:hypothetical protein
MRDMTKRGNREPAKILLVEANSGGAPEDVLLDGHMQYLPMHLAKAGRI